MSTDPATASSAIGTRTIQKLRLRILPFVLLLFVVALIDRNNVAFAALTMNKKLAIASRQFGLLFGLFYFGYFIFEVPSNLLLHKLGATSAGSATDRRVRGGCRSLRLLPDPVLPDREGLGCARNVLGLLIGFLAAANYLGATMGTRLSNFLTIAKLLVALLFISAGFTALLLRPAVRVVPLAMSITSAEKSFGSSSGMVGDPEVIGPRVQP